MPVILEGSDLAELYTVVADDSLESIATAKCPDLGWKILARYNWGTETPLEIRRAICETVGVHLPDLANELLQATPEKMKLTPDADLAPQLKIPKAWKKDSLALLKTHTVEVKRKRPANAVAIVELDKWFLPETEKCAIKYRLEGEKLGADKVELNVFGSKYCECTAWSDGKGTYGNPDDLIDEPIYKLDLTAAAQVDQRTEYELPGDGWKGEATTILGMLGRKTGSAAKRHINVAFSPYTAHFRYWKADADKTARLLLEPFWPQWEDVLTTPPVGAPEDVTLGSVFDEQAVSSFDVTWTNAADADFGVVDITDASGQLVFQVDLLPAKLKAGEQSYEWSGEYRKDALNGNFKDRYIDDAPPQGAGTDPNANVLFRSAPYVYRVRTFKRKLIDASMKIEWKVKNTTKLKLGLLIITDGAGKIVFQKPLPAAKLGAGNNFTWDGVYGDGVKNSKEETTIIPEDMPYRVQIQGHSGIDTPDGLALAAMHTEVRLYVHKDMRRPKDKRFDQLKAKPSLALAKAPFTALDPPAQGSTKWCRLELAKAGFQPGPVTDKPAADPEYHIALKEFKRSVPASGSAGPGLFTRLTVDTAEGATLTTAITSLRAGDKRTIFGDPEKVAANSDVPDFSDDEVKERLRDPEKEILLWVDDRHYFTGGWGAKDDNGGDFLTGSIGLGDYRPKLENGDEKATVFDADSISRPWIPLQVDMPLMGREDKWIVDYDQAKVVVEDETKRNAMRRAIGPLRVDWTFTELPADVATIDPADYSAATIRARKYTAWALRQNQDTHTRKDTGLETKYPNCKKSLGGIRDSLAGYYKDGFGTGDLNLEPCPAIPAVATESVATIVHDHIAAAQTNKTTNLFEDRIGLAGVYFHPSSIAGDGYRVRTEVKFKPCDGYAFPNLENLKKRYPVRPQANSAKMRVWRRSTFRGYLYWGTGNTGHWPSALGRFRRQYRAAHVYFIHEGGAPGNFQVNTLFNPAEPTHVTRYKNIIHHNITDPGINPINKMTLKAGYVWPWNDSNDFGFPYDSPIDMAENDIWSKWLNDNILSSTWNLFREGLYLAVLQEIEKQGHLRGHLILEFKESEQFHVRQYTCDRHATQGPPHTWWIMQKGAQSATPRTPASWGWTCPAPACFKSPVGDPNPAVTSLYLPTNPAKTIQYTHMPCAAVGLELGGTWVYQSSDGKTCSEDEFVADTWVHEVGHHRHLKHSATAPEAQYSAFPLGRSEHHDSERNEKTYAVANGNGVNERWDRDCIMSYAVGKRHFCGKCLLRNRGWAIEALGYPGPTVTEPA